MGAHTINTACLDGALSTFSGTQAQLVQAIIYSEGRPLQGHPELVSQNPHAWGGLHDRGWGALAAEAGHAEEGLSTCTIRGTHLEQVDVPPRLGAKALCGQAVVCGNLVQQASLV